MRRAGSRRIPACRSCRGCKYLREQAQEARDLLYKRNTNLRLNWCVWTQQADAFIPLEQWDACADRTLTLDAFKGRPCFVGMDLSSTHRYHGARAAGGRRRRDAALVGGRLAAAGSHHRAGASRRRAVLDVGARRGDLRTTDGTVVDYSAIKMRIREWAARGLDLREICFDPWNATQTATDLESEGFVPVQFRQGFATMSEPTKHLAARLMARTVRHRGNPVSRYQVMNLAIATDPAGNIKLDKGKATGRIDIFAAGVTGPDPRYCDARTFQSIYATRGVLVM